ncbi:MAG: site-2 protease family protein [Prochlorotrichaceae cyanobacterium]|jgi:membrane-associated protease RseP (regulator of RpoE activity)
MFLWFWLFFLGWITYLLLQRSIASHGATPLWVLWLVLMMPALIWGLWTLFFGQDVEPPLWLMLGPFVVCPFVYWLLVRNSFSQQRKRKSVSPEDLSPTTTQKLEQLLTEGEKPPSPPPVPRPLSKEEEADLKHCFPWNLFALHQVEYRLQAVICQGQLRADPSEAYTRIQTNISQRFGDRFLVLLQENWTGKPFFALVPNVQKYSGGVDQLLEPQEVLPAASSDRRDSFYRPTIALGLLLVTLFTTTFVGTIFAGVPLESLADLSDRPSLLWQGFPYALSLILILGAHELGHVFAARRHHIATTLPYFIPVPTFLGTFGAFTQIKSPIPHRRALFDISFAGPAAGVLITLPLLWWGLQHSEVIPLTKESSLTNFESLNPWNSLLLTLISRWALGESLTPESALALHPVAIAAYLGIIVTALNLMPVGQLDGGHIVHAMFGQRTGAIVGQMTRFFMLILSLRQQEFLLWSLLLLFIPVVDEPALNDVSELDDGRDGLGFLALALLLMILLPVPQILQGIFL